MPFHSRQAYFRVSQEQDLLTTRPMRAAGRHRANAAAADVLRDVCPIRVVITHSADVKKGAVCESGFTRRNLRQFKKSRGLNYWSAVSRMR